MSLRPIRSKRAGKRGYYRAFRTREQWKPWKGWGPAKVKHEFLGSRKRLIGTICLILLIGVFITDQALKTPGQASPIGQDPIKPLWYDPMNSNNLAGFDYVNTAIRPGNPGTVRGLLLTPNATFPALAIDQQPIDVSVATAKVLEIIQQFVMFTTANTQPNQWQVFLTVNKTASKSPSFSPGFDVSTRFIIATFLTNIAFPNANAQNIMYIQQDPTVTIAQGDIGCTSGTAVRCGTTISINYASGTFLSAGWLNYTGTTATGSSSSLWITGQRDDFIRLPNLNLNDKYYLGFFVPPTTNSNTVLAYSSFDPPNLDPYGTGQWQVNNMILAYYVPPAAGPPTFLDTSGFFGPIIKALINLGVWMLNALFGAIGFITPALQSALGVLENVMAGILNFIGGFIGYSTAGTDFINFLNQMFNFFTGVCGGPHPGLPCAFINFPTLFTDFLSWLQVVFPVITPAFTLASGILNFGVAAISQAITIFTIGLQLVLFGYAFILIFSYFIFTGDDAAGGLLTYLGTAQAIAFRIINLIALLVNFGLDIFANLLGLIPKPLIQIAAAKFPRLPILDTSASITIPAMDFAELRNGNLLSVWLWTIGFYFDVWYESRNPALPGSLGSLVPSVASNMQLLSSLLPMLQVFVFISGGTMLFWMVMRPLHLMGADLGIFESIGIGAGGRSGAGPSGFKISGGKKHLLGRLKPKEEQVGKGKFGPSQKSVEEQATA